MGGWGTGVAESELAGAASDAGAVIGELLTDAAGAEVAETGVRVPGSEAGIVGEGSTSVGPGSSFLRWRRDLEVFFELRFDCSSR